jgi:hypothetical protein
VYRHGQIIPSNCTPSSDAAAVMRRAWTAQRARTAAHHLVVEARVGSPPNGRRPGPSLGRARTPHHLLVSIVHPAVGFDWILERAVAGGETFGLVCLGFFGSMGRFASFNVAIGSGWIVRLRPAPCRDIRPYATGMVSAIVGRRPGTSAFGFTSNYQFTSLGTVI